MNVKRNTLIDPLNAGGLDNVDQFFEGKHNVGNGNGNIGLKHMIGNACQENWCDAVYNSWYPQKLSWRILFQMGKMTFRADGCAEQANIEKINSPRSVVKQK